MRLENRDDKLAVHFSTDGEGHATGASLDVSSMHLFAYVGFGFYFSWVWLGLYEGYPVFQTGDIDVIACGVLLSGFSLCLLVAGFVPAARRRVLSWQALLAGALTACLASLLMTLFQLDSVLLTPPVYLLLVRICLIFVGAGTAVMLLHFGLFFSGLEPSRALLAFCVSFLAAFFSFIWADSTPFPFSCLLISAFPLVCALSMRRFGKTMEGEPEGSAPGKDRYAKGFVHMVVTFGVFVFIASLTQSLEPQKDFAISADEGMIGFFLVTAVVFYLVTLSKRDVGTFSVLKRLYQAGIVLMVVKFILQPLASDNLGFAALNIVTYLTLFMVFWLLAAFVGHIGELCPAKAFSLLFGVAGVCMALGWAIGDLIYAQFGHERYFISIAAGCTYTVFCTFGFSVKDFPRLTISGKGAEKMERRKHPAQAAEEPPVLTAEMAIDEIAAEKKLSPREKEIFCMLAEGKTTEAIAEELVISYYTVRTHIRNLYTKLEVSSRSDLLVLVMQQEGKQKADPQPPAD